MAGTERNTDAPECVEWPSFNKWTGSAEQLISAGVIERHMLPGEPGRNKTCVTIGGGRNQHAKFDENYVQILKQGKNKFRVKKGISKDEKRQRELYYKDAGEKRRKMSLI